MLQRRFRVVRKFLVLSSLLQLIWSQTFSVCPNPLFSFTVYFEVLLSYILALTITLIWFGRTLMGAENTRAFWDPQSHKYLQGCLSSSLFCSSFKKKKKARWIPPTLWNAVFFFFFFCDRSTDQYGKPRGTSPCLSALGETRGFVFYAG